MARLAVLALIFLSVESFMLSPRLLSQRSVRANWGLGMMTSSDQATAQSMRTAVNNLDSSAVSALLEAGETMDEVTTNAAFWAVVNAINLAEQQDKPLSAEVPRMIHHVFDADLRNLQNREQLRTNITCMQPALEGAASFGNSIGYLMDDLTHQDLPLKEGRKCEGGTCCDECSRNIFQTFALPNECNPEQFPGLNQFTFNEVEKVATATILQFVRLIERVRRTVAYEYGLQLDTILPLQAYSRKYVAGTTQQGGGGGEGDFVILHTDESTHASYHYSSVLYLSTQDEDFGGGNFVFNDPAKSGSESEPETNKEDDFEPKSLAEEMAHARRKGRDLKPFHPTRGAAVVFSSGWENMHEVEKLTWGTRYAVPCFFTTCPVPEGAYTQMVVGKPKTDEDIADDWLHLLLAHRREEPQESVGRVKELLMKWHYMCTPLSQHPKSEQASEAAAKAMAEAEALGRAQAEANAAAAEKAKADLEANRSVKAEAYTATKAQQAEALQAQADQRKVAAQTQAPQAQAPPAAAAAAAPAAQTVNPYANWASAVDPATGNTYYYDTVTGKTSWTWPPEVN